VLTTPAAAAAMVPAPPRADPATVVQLHGLLGKRGAVVRGRTPLSGVQLATGDGPPEIPVVIATGHEQTTPRLLVSANIHGNEVNGLIVAHRLIADLEKAAKDKTLVGTVVVRPPCPPCAPLSCPGLLLRLPCSCCRLD